MARGHVRKRGSTWTYVIELPRDPETGKRRPKWKGGFRTKKEAQAALNQALAEVQAGGFAAPTKETVGQYLEHWLRDAARPTLAISSYELYCRHVRQYIVPALGHLLLCRLQPLHLQEFYGRSLESGRLLPRKGYGPGLSPATVHHFHRILHRAHDQAVRWKLLPTNPADQAVPPRVPRREFPILTEAELVQLLTAARETRLYLPILIGATTGMRIGEAVAVRWADVDLGRGRLQVNQSLQRLERGLYFQPPKTEKSRREILLPAFVTAELARHQQAQAARKAELKPQGLWNDYYGLVACREDGTPWHPGTFTNYFRRLLRKLGLPVVRFQDLRHTHTTHLLKAGVSAKVVSERLGHASVAFTLDRYGHVIPGMQESAAAATDRALRDAVNGPEEPAEEPAAEDIREEPEDEEPGEQAA